MATEISETDDRFPKRALVKDWLDTEWSLSEAYDPNTSWVVQATNKSGAADGQAFVVLQTTIFPDQMLIQGSVAVEPEMQDQLAAMAAAERSEFLWELRFGLLKLGVEFIGVADPLEEVMIRKCIWDDGLTKDEFMNRVDQVNSAVIYVLWTLQRRMPATESSAEVTFVN
jgi:hypothetical protein